MSHPTFYLTLTLCHISSSVTLLFLSLFFLKFLLLFFVFLPRHIPLSTTLQLSVHISPPVTFFFSLFFPSFFWLPLPLTILLSTTLPATYSSSSTYLLQPHSTCLSLDTSHLLPHPQLPIYHLPPIFFSHILPVFLSTHPTFYHILNYLSIYSPTNLLHQHSTCLPLDTSFIHLSHLSLPLRSLPTFPFLRHT